MVANKQTAAKAAFSTGQNISPYVDAILLKLCTSLSGGIQALRNFMENNSYHPITQHNEVYIEMDLLRVGSEPVGMRCPYCQEEIMTNAHYRSTTKTHILAIVLGIIFWWLCCCILPYVTKRWKNVEHYCPKCHRFLGVYTRN